MLGLAPSAPTLRAYHLYLFRRTAATPAPFSLRIKNSAKATQPEEQYTGKFTTLYNSLPRISPTTLLGYYRTHPSIQLTINFDCLFQPNHIEYVKQDYNKTAASI